MLYALVAQGYTNSPSPEPTVVPTAVELAETGGDVMVAMVTTLALLAIGVTVLLVARWYDRHNV